MPCKYTLEWLDTAITIHLNPVKNDLSSLPDEQLNAMIEAAISEAARLPHAINEQVFGLSTERQVTVLVRQYHSALITLYDKAFENSKSAAGTRDLLTSLCSRLSLLVGELLYFIEQRYPRYLSLDERVPYTYMETTGRELKERLDQMKPALLQAGEDPALTDIIADELCWFTVTRGRHSLLTFRELFYHKELVHALETLALCSNEGCTVSAVNELLVYMNFNSKAYVHYFTRHIATQLDDIAQHSDRINRLLLHMKEFNQIHRREDARLNYHDADLKITIGAWFTHELYYLERKLQPDALSGSAGEVPGSKQSAMQKLFCALSVDQIALILRSADELKILVARSLNSIFKSIAPFLSTACKENISADSMRSKAYSAETRDKKIVIAKLEEMIARIREY